MMKYHLNLASGTYVNHRQVRAILAVMGIILVGLLVVNTMTVLRDTSRREELELRLNELDGQEKGRGTQKEVSRSALAGQEKRIRLANELLVRDSYRWTALLDSLENHLPDGVSIRSLQPDYQSGLLNLTGVAASVGDLRKFIDNLSRSTVFTHLYLKEQRTVRGSDESSGGISFSIELQRGRVNES